MTDGNDSDGSENGEREEARPRRQRRTTSGAPARRRGSPFARGEDKRRNMKGRRATPVQTPKEIVMAVLLAPQKVVRNGKRQRITKLEAALERHLLAAMNGDDKGVRASVALVRAVKDLSVDKAPGEDASTQAHNVGELNKLLEEYAEKYQQAKQDRQAGEGVPDEGGAEE